MRVICKHDHSHHGITKGKVYDAEYLQSNRWYYQLINDNGEKLSYPARIFGFYCEDKLEPYDRSKHYKQKVEPIDLIEAFELGFNRGNVIKYVARAGRKDDELEDLNKASWYLQREIKNLEDGE